MCNLHESMRVFENRASNFGGFFLLFCGIKIMPFCTVSDLGARNKITAAREKTTAAKDFSLAAVILNDSVRANAMRKIRIIAVARILGTA